MFCSHVEQREWLTLLQPPMPGQKVESTNAKRILRPSFCFEVVASRREKAQASNREVTAPNVSHHLSFHNEVRMNFLSFVKASTNANRGEEGTLPLNHP